MRVKHACVLAAVSGQLRVFRQKSIERSFILRRHKLRGGGSRNKTPVCLPALGRHLWPVSVRQGVEWVGERHVRSTRASCACFLSNSVALGGSFAQALGDGQRQPRGKAPALMGPLIQTCLSAGALDLRLGRLGFAIASMTSASTGVGSSSAATAGVAVRAAWALVCER